MTALSIVPAVMATQEPLRNIMYLTGQHPVIPDLTLTSTITHVVLAFMPSGIFNEEEPDPLWPLFLSVAEVRARFRPGTKVMVAIGGWGDTEGFATAARDNSSRQFFAERVAVMVEVTGADGVDIDWEYPGGNGEDYKQVPNSQKAWEATAYPQLLACLRCRLGPSNLLSAAVPGIPRDIALAFTPATVPDIMASVDFLNVMTYDLMNRRDAATRHHTGVAGSLASLDFYLKAGAPAARLNLGFAFYVKYFRVPSDACASSSNGTSTTSTAAADPLPGLGCPTGPMEDPETGADLGRTGGFSYHDRVPDDVAESFLKALAQGTYDERGGGYYYLDDDWDGDNDDDLFWTFDTPDAIARKFPLIVESKGLGGVFAWGLGEDAPEFAHLQALADGVVRSQAGGRARDEL
ncbi:chitinase 18-4 [Apiospora phragmitis]|uniref:chitinase n=1 Tax=Apiospora phragmitis TaxID=2905665 RepID=A0ABR1V3I1_9PEZI